MKKNKKLMIIAVPILFILAVAVGYEYVYLTVKADIDSLLERQEMKMKTLEKYINLIAQRAEFERLLEEKRELAKARASHFVTGDSISIASANLQALVKGIVTSRGGILTSERIGKPEPLDKEQGEAASPIQTDSKKAGLKKKKQAADFVKIQALSVSIDATLPDVAALNDILYSIETRTPDLVIKELDVRVRNFRDPRELLVRIEVKGLYEGK